MREIIFVLLLLGSCGYALLYGRQDTRIIGAVCITASIASLAVASRYSGVEIGVFAIDLLSLSAFVFVALRSDRFWPLWVSGFQTTAILGHVLKAIQLDLVPIAYAVSLRFWGYPILIVLAVSTWRDRQRPRVTSVPIQI